MGYSEMKRRAEHELLASIHGSELPAELQSEGSSFDGGAREVRHLPHLPDYLFRPPTEARDELGWGPEYEIEDGAALLFPWLENER